MSTEEIIHVLTRLRPQKSQKVCRCLTRTARLLSLYRKACITRALMIYGNYCIDPIHCELRPLLHVDVFVLSISD